MGELVSTHFKGNLKVFVFAVILLLLIHVIAVVGVDVTIPSCVPPNFLNLDSVWLLVIEQVDE